MKTGIAGGLSILAATLVFFLFRSLPFAGSVIADVFTVAVLLFGTFYGEIPGAVLGAIGGLIIDTFSLGIFGLSGMSLTAGGFLAGFVSRKINIQSWTRSLLFFAVLSIGVFAAGTGLAFLIGRSPIPWAGGLLLVRPSVTAVAAVLLHESIRRWKVRHDR
jgi:cell shape-determining protein MreD